MPRTSRLFGKALLASIGARWEMDKLYYNAEEVEQGKFRRILAASSEHKMRQPDRVSPPKYISEKKCADDFDVIDCKVNIDCRKRNPLLRDFELSILEAREPLELSLEGPLNFDLVLQRIAPNSSPFAPDLVVVEDGIPVDVRPHHFLYEGIVEGDPQSRVFGSRIDAFDGQINFSDGNSFTVEKLTKLRKRSSIPEGVSLVIRDKLSPEEMKKREKEEEMKEEERQTKSEDEEENEEIERREREIEEKRRRQNQEKKQNETEEEVEKENKMELEEQNYKIELLLLDDFYKKQKYRYKITNKQPKICNMHLKIEYKLYHQILTHEGNNDPKRTREEIIAMLYTNLRAVNDIFANTNFYTRGIQFAVKKITIQTQDNENPSEIILDKNNLEDRDDYLDRISDDQSDFCLAYLLTFRTFSEPDLRGFAVSAYPEYGSNSGVCGSFTPFDEFGRWLNRSSNFGVVNLRQHNGSRLPARWVQLVFAHELGHSLGASHDPRVPPKETFLMNVTVRGTKAVEHPNHSRFSSNSIKEMSAVIDALERSIFFVPSGVVLIARRSLRASWRCMARMALHLCHGTMRRLIPIRIGAIQFPLLIPRIFRKSVPTLMGNMTDDAQWIIARHADPIVFHPMTNLITSWIGYALLAVMIYACAKKSVFWKRAHDVFLLLIVAFIVDFLEMRLNFFFVFGMIDDHEGHSKHAPTTVGACTLGVWVFYFHFLYTYVEAIVTAYRFVTRTLGKALSVSYVYVGLGVVFALQGSLLFETFFHGKPESVINEQVGWPVFCTKAYVYEGPALISQIATAIAMSIAPILSVIMIFKKSKSAKKESGVTAFNLFSSFSMMFLVYIYLSAMYLDIDKYIPAKIGRTLNMIMLVSLNIQYFRFPLLCMSATFCVADIRRPYGP